MSYLNEIPKGGDLEMIGVSNIDLSTKDGFAIHIKYMNGRIVAKYSSNVIADYEQRLTDIDGFTFLIKIPRTLTETLDLNAKLDAVLYYQEINADYPDGVFRPVTGCESFGTVSECETETVPLV